MEFLVIGDTKLKISLSAEECMDYNIDVTQEDFSTVGIRRVVRDLLRIAEDKAGFSVGEEKILAQVYPLPDGTCEIFITMLRSLSYREERELSASREINTYQKRRGVYRFCDADVLRSAAMAIYRDGVECDLYLSESGEYYIEIDEDVIDGISEFEILIEFGERVRELPLYIVSEYGTCLAKGDGLSYAIGL